MIAGLVAWPFRARVKRRDKAERAEGLRIQAEKEEKAAVERAALEAQIKQQAEDSAAQSERLQTRFDQQNALLERFMYRETANAGENADAETLAKTREAAEDILTEGGDEEAAALEAIANGDESGFDTLAALAQAKDSVTRQAEAEATDKARESAAFWIRIGDLAAMNHTERALHAYEQAHALAPEDAHVWNELGHLYDRTVRIDEAITAYTKLLDNAGDNSEDQATAFNNLGNIAEIRGDLDAAEDYQKRSLAIGETLGDKQGIAISLVSLGNIAQTRGDLDAAEEYQKRSLAINETLGNKEGIANSLNNLGNIAETRGDLDAAEEYQKRSLAINETLGNKQGIARSLGNLGIVAKTRGDLDAAEDYQKRSLAIDETLGNKQGIAASLGNLGNIAEARGDLDAAEDYQKRSLAIEETLGNKEGMAASLGNLGNIAETRGDLAEACGLWNRAKTLFEEVGARQEVEQVAGSLREVGCPEAG